MFAERIHGSFQLLLGGPETPLAERALRVALLVCVVSIALQWVAMWGTRWGDRHRVAKSFVMSMLLHLCLCLSWATVIHQLPAATGEPEPAEQSAVQAVAVAFVEPTERALAESAARQSTWRSATDVVPLQRDFKPAVRPPATETTAVPRESVALAAEPLELPEWSTSIEPTERPRVEPSIPDTTAIRRAAASTPVPEETRVSREPAPRSNEFARRPPPRRSSASTDETPVARAPAAAPARPELPSRDQDDVALMSSTPVLTPTTPLPAAATDPTADRGIRRRAPLPAEELVEPTTGTVFGTVTDAATGRGLAGTVIRFDRDRGTPVVTRTDARGNYELALPDTPDSFALTITRAEYLPVARNLSAREVRGKSRRVDITLSPLSGNVIALEDRPEVHHLGNDQFEGSANSRFQRRTEGAERTFRFNVTEAQLRSPASEAAVTLMAKGIQCAPDLRLNGRKLDTLRQFSPDDGTYGTVVWPFDLRWLTPGQNTLIIRATDCNDDLDDFEFVNVQIRLTNRVSSKSR